MLRTLLKTTVDTINAFYGRHIRVLIVKIEEDTNKCTILQHKAFKLKHYYPDKFQFCLLGHTQRMYISVCINFNFSHLFSNLFSLRTEKVATRAKTQIM